MDILQRDSAHFHDFLRSHRVQELLRGKGDLIEVGDHATLAETLEVLNRNNVLAVPVVGEAGRWLGAGEVEAVANGGKQYIGIVSILDIFNFLVQENSKRAGASELDTLSKTRVTNLIGQSLESLSLWVAKPDETLLEALEPLSKIVHRFLVPVANAGGAGIGYRLCTQTDVVRFLYTYMFQQSSGLAIFTQKSIAELRLGGKIVSVSALSLASDALNMMSAFRITAVPVVDANGHIVGTLSISDFRRLISSDTAHLQRLDQLFSKSSALQSSTSPPLPQQHQHATPITDTLGHFHLPTGTVGQFLMWIHHATSIEQLPPSVTCRPSDSLNAVIAAALARRVHRVWIVEGNYEPTGVITFTDVIRSLYEFSKRSTDASAHHSS